MKLVLGSLMVILSLMSCDNCDNKKDYRDSIKYVEVTSAEYLIKVEKGSSGSSGLGGAIVGGLAFGPIGAITGAIVGKSGPTPDSEKIVCKIDFQYKQYKYRLVRTGASCLKFTEGRVFKAKPSRGSEDILIIESFTFLERVLNKEDIKWRDR